MRAPRWTSTRRFMQRATPLLHRPCLARLRPRLQSPGTPRASCCIPDPSSDNSPPTAEPQANGRSDHHPFPVRVPQLPSGGRASATPPSRRRQPPAELAQTAPPLQDAQGEATRRRRAAKSVDLPSRHHQAQAVEEQEWYATLISRPISFGPSSRAMARPQAPRANRERRLHHLQGQTAEVRRDETHLPTVRPP